MRSTTARYLAAGVIALGGCGGGGPDNTIHHDAGTLDGAPIPAPPTLGAQLDRMGRPLIATALIGVFAQDPAAVRDAYDLASDPAAWPTTLLPTGRTIEAEIEANLAVFDAWDLAASNISLPTGCGNALSYLGPPGAMSYRGAADLFADDQLYVDTAITTSCAVYLAVELAHADMRGHIDCGGRMPSHDVVDMTYSVLAAGLNGLGFQSANYAPKIHDGVTAHADIKESVFPFLGPQHP